MSASGRSEFRVAPQYQPLMRAVGLDADAVFDHPDIVAWRKLPDRENCTLDAQWDDKPLRLHIKRYLVSSSGVDDEVKGIELLKAEQIPTMNLVGWGKLADGRSFIITEDLKGFSAADKLIEAGMKTFDQLLEPTADLAARLHRCGLHHRDLYLCHFFARGEGELDVRLIDAARVARLGGILVRGRWIVKDLAQFWYSTTSLNVNDEQRRRWLERYARQRGIEMTPRLVRAIERKVRWIARHDEKLKTAQPTRNLSIPESSPSPLVGEGGGEGEAVQTPETAPPPEVQNESSPRESARVTPHPSPLPQGEREQLQSERSRAKSARPTPHPNPLPQGKRGPEQ